MRIQLSIERHGHQGFSVKDLLAVLASVCLLGFIEFAALGNGIGKNRLATCLANFEQLSLAWSLYTEDNNTKLVWNPGGSDAGMNSAKPAWAGGTMSIGTSDYTNTELLVNYGSSAGKWGGLLGSYVKKNYSVFRCPEDQPISLFGRQFSRVRSVSMNGYMAPANAGSNTWTSSAFKTFRKTSDIVSLKPSNAIVFMDESENTIDDEVWSIDLSHCIDRGGNLTPASFSFIDLPGSRHDRGSVLSFADAHVEHWKWQDQRTMPKSGQTVLAPNNVDIGRVAQSISTR